MVSFNGSNTRTSLPNPSNMEVRSARASQIETRDVAGKLDSVAQPRQWPPKRPYKKPALLRGLVAFLGGDGGSRTPVQNRSPVACYVRSQCFACSGKLPLTGSRRSEPNCL